MSFMVLQTQGLHLLQDWTTEEATLNEKNWFVASSSLGSGTLAQRSQGDAKQSRQSG